MIQKYKLEFALLMIIILAGGTILSLYIRPGKNVTTTTTPISTETINTGAIIPAKSDYEIAQDKEDTRLFKMLPMSGSGFSVNYYAPKDVYQVTLTQPYEAARANFYSWISQNGFSTMAKDRFELILK